MILTFLPRGARVFGSSAARRTSAATFSFPRWDRTKKIALHAVNSTTVAGRLSLGSPAEGKMFRVPPEGSKSYTKPFSRRPSSRATTTRFVLMEGWLTMGSPAGWKREGGRGERAERESPSRRKTYHVPRPGDGGRPEPSR